MTLNLPAADRASLTFSKDCKPKEKKCVEINKVFTYHIRSLYDALQKCFLEVREEFFYNKNANVTLIRKKRNQVACCALTFKSYKAENRQQSIINHLTEAERIIWHEKNL